jgi:thiosulfate reductase cytochrome b subunit
VGAAQALVVSQSLGFPGWLRLSHYLNLLFMVFLVRSGIEILMSHPRLYWNDGCTPGSEWLKFTKKKVPTGPDVLYTAREDEVDVSPWLAMPGHKNLGIGRHWHGVTNSLWLLTGLVYGVLLFGTGEWRRLIPTSWDVFPRAWHSLTTYLSLQVPPLSEFQPYDALQQLTYAVVVFVLAPVMLVTGAAMSPAIAASFPWYIKLLGGRQVARSIHFLGMLAFTVFVVFHVFFVLVVHPRENLTNITLGGQPERLGLALAEEASRRGAVVTLLAANLAAAGPGWAARRVRKRVHAARQYSWSRPPSRSRRCTLPFRPSSTMVSPMAGSGAWSCSARCARCRL